MKERVIGIDFGTSTSLIRVRTYESEDDSRSRTGDSQYVEFDGKAVVPTLVRIDGNSEYFGYDAQPDRVGSVLYSDFKMNLESAWQDKRETAEMLTEKFLGYMYRQYADQDSYFGPCDTVRTLISYPAKWREETRKFMQDAAACAGFQNVCGMDEATAAMHAVRVQYGDYLKKTGLFRAERFHMLMIDMGAGTTDLALCRYSRQGNEILAVWPDAESNLFFGGNEMDSILGDYLGGYLRENGISEEITEKFMRQYRVSCKQWKENTVSKLLGDGASVDSCPFVSNIFHLWNVIPRPFPELDRNRLQEISAGYLRIFTFLIRGMLDDVISRGILKSPADIDLVLLTGGHSQWYFVKEILLDKTDCCEPLGLVTIQREPERILRMARPHETVGCGLVWSVHTGGACCGENLEKESGDKEVYQGVSQDDGTSDDSVQKEDPVKEEDAALIISRAKEGDAAAQYLAGDAYQNGRGVSCNPAAARYWWRESARQGNRDAMWKFGCAVLTDAGGPFYIAGRTAGRERNGDSPAEESAFWICRAAQKEQIEAQIYLAYNSEMYKELFSWSRKILARTDLDPERRYLTGYSTAGGIVEEYQTGRCVVSQLQNFIGECFFFGLGTYRDYVQAFQYFEAAAAKMSDSCDFGAQQACRNLGMCYQWGKGTAPDLLHARSMYGFVKMDREYPTMGEALEAWTGADGGRAAYLEEEDFKGYFAHRFPQSLRMIPQADLQRFLQANPGIQNGEELYLLKTVNKREQLLGKPVTVFTAVTNMRIFAVTVNGPGQWSVNWSIPYQFLKEAVLEAKLPAGTPVRLPGKWGENLVKAPVSQFMRNVVLYTYPDMESRMRDETKLVETSVREPWFPTAVNLLARRNQWRNREGIYQI